MPGGQSPTTHPLWGQCPVLTRLSTAVCFRMRWRAPLPTSTKWRLILIGSVTREGLEQSGTDLEQLVTNKLLKSPFLQPCPCTAQSTPLGLAVPCVMVHGPSQAHIP